MDKGKYRNILRNYLLRPDRSSEYRNILAGYANVLLAAQWIDGATCQRIVEYPDKGDTTPQAVDEFLDSVEIGEISAQEYARLFDMLSSSYRVGLERGISAATAKLTGELLGYLLGGFALGFMDLEQMAILYDTATAADRTSEDVENLLAEVLGYDGR